jgi:phosphoglucomutase/phosphomannomutase
VKVYWSSGGQLLPPHDAAAIERMKRVTWIERIEFTQGVESGQIVYCQEEVDAAFIESLRALSTPGPRNLKIIYSPLHGVGATSICPVLEADGFADVELFAPHAQPDGDFPNVPGHISNPENPATFDSIIERATETGADVVLSTDPDADRLGCAAPLTPGGPWRTLNGNQLGALLADHVLEQRQAAGTLTAEHYIIKTLVTTELIRRIADSYDVKTYGNIHVGFKWIGQLIDEVGPEKFVFAAEESHGYLAGSHCRDKDGAVAAMLLAELAARTKADGQTLHQKLDTLFCRHGCYAEKMISTKMPGSEGMARMQQLMADIRQNPPPALAGIRVRRMRDYLHGVIRTPGRAEQPLDGPEGNLVVIDLEAEGNYVAVRPSGTEPKVKFYMFAYEPPGPPAELQSTKRKLAERVEQMERELTALAGV